ncbi:hypothetical protein [Jeotgalibacillus sp. JSM ZJ347]|uniref:hypothetical protein n=1 Tax=Jeotgalibacillus sp. JSM ZJ347 TaxID=3342117 RepID=UPI0035A82AA1
MTLTPTVTCINGPLVNTSCTFTVSQVICVTIPLKFSADVSAVPSGGACGEAVAGSLRPSNQDDDLE